MNIHNAQAIYTNGTVDGALNFANFLIEKFEQDDAGKSRSSHKKAIERTRQYATQFQLEAELNGFPCRALPRRRKWDGGGNGRIRSVLMGILAAPFIYAVIWWFLAIGNVLTMEIPQ